MTAEPESSDLGALPTRRRAGRRGGRHRGGSFTLPPGSPAVVLAGASSEVLAGLADIIQAAHSGVPVRSAGDDLTDLTGSPTAVVVPVLTGPNPALEDPLREGLRDLPVLVTEPLGPHPLLAEALHLRLAEVGLARADRIRMMSMVTAADGIVLGVHTIDESSEITAVLLASRLAIPVVAARLDEPEALASAVAALRSSGAVRPALSPCVIDVNPDVLATAVAAAGVEYSAPLGAHPSLAQLAVLRYVEALEAAYLD
ncbi:MAG: hypothetical protein ABIS86_23350 [Streptosporangiaceae bacterium]